MRVVEAQLASQREVSEQQAVQVSELQAQVLAQEEQLAEVPKYLERWGGGGGWLIKYLDRCWDERGRGNPWATSPQTLLCSFFSTRLPPQSRHLPLTICLHQLTQIPCFLFFFPHELCLPSVF